MTQRELSKHDLSCEINDEGGWEEFHQKRRNYYMYDHHKARRLLLIAEYKRRSSNAKRNAENPVSSS